jgi:hypothetical protein
VPSASLESEADYSPGQRRFVVPDGDVDWAEQQHIRRVPELSRKRALHNPVGRLDR